MQCQEFNINAAQGVRLLAEVNLGGQIFKKGHTLTAEDIIIFKMFDIRKIMGAVVEDSDIEDKAAVGMIAAKLCGVDTAFRVIDGGKCQIVSLSNGVLMCSAERIGKFNRLHRDVVLNTVAPHSLVEPFQIVAELAVLSPLMTQTEVDDVLFKLSGNTALLEVSKVEERRAALIYARLENDTQETEHFTKVVKALVTNMLNSGVEFVQEYNTTYTIGGIADEIEKSIAAGNEISFILPALPAAGQGDVSATALRQIVDEIACKGLPVLNMADFMLAQKREHKIIILPYHYADEAPAIVNQTIRQAIFAEKLFAQDFAHLPVPDLSAQEYLAEEAQSSLIMPKNYGAKGKKANIGVVVLAAGQGRRAGRNKLMIDVGDNTPLFMKAVEAAIKSDASPVFVVTGYHDEEMQAFLDEVDVNVVYNAGYVSGVKTSIELGLKSIPSFCDGAMLLPADMPNLTAEDLNKLIAKFKLGAEKQVIMFSNKGRKSNPVIWSKSLFDVADVVPENANERPVFMEHADYTTVVELKEEQKLLDVTFPSDVEAVAAKE